MISTVEQLNAIFENHRVMGYFSYEAEKTEQGYLLHVLEVEEIKLNDWEPIFESSVLLWEIELDHKGAIIKARYASEFSMKYSSKLQQFIRELCNREIALSLLDDLVIQTDIKFEQMEGES